MPELNIDLDAVYPAGIVILIAGAVFARYKWFPTYSDMEQRLSELELKIAEKYVLKDDFQRKFDEFKEDVKADLQDIKRTIGKLFDKVDEALKR